MTNVLDRFVYTDSYMPDSGVLANAYYDQANRRLAIELHNGTMLGYSGVESSTWQAFKSAGSAGSFWNRYIKTNKSFGRFDVDVEDLYSENEVEDEPVGAMQSMFAVEADSAVEADTEVNLPTSFTLTVEVTGATTLGAAVVQAEAAGLKVVSAYA